MAISSHILPETGFLRLKQIIGSESANIPAIIPLSRSCWYQGIKDGRFPQPVKLGRCSVWKASDIKQLVERIGGGQ